MTTDLVRRDEAAPATDEDGGLDLELVKSLLCPGISDGQLALFGQVCRRTGLDPFRKEIYPILRRSGQTGRAELTIVTGIDGFRKAAGRSGRYRGQDAPEWCGEDGVWRDVWLSDRPPAAARVRVYRSDTERPTEAVVTYRSFAQAYQGKPTGKWATSPDHMLAKCCEAQALRRAFPEEIAGLDLNTEPSYAEAVAEQGPGRCDAVEMRRRWFATVAGTFLDSDEARHEFVREYTAGETGSLSDFLAGATFSEANRLLHAAWTAINRPPRQAEPGEYDAEPDGEPGVEDIAD